MTTYSTSQSRKYSPSASPQTEKFILIEAALFAFKAPFSKDALLADEVGLGKTIEAGLVISQKWAERRHKILVITPSNLRKQWHREFAEKFFSLAALWSVTSTICAALAW